MVNKKASVRKNFLTCKNGPTMKNWYLVFQSCSMGPQCPGSVPLRDTMGERYLTGGAQGPCAASA